MIASLIYRLLGKSMLLLERLDLLSNKVPRGEHLLICIVILLDPAFTDSFQDTYLERSALLFFVLAK